MSGARGQGRKKPTEEKSDAVMGALYFSTGTGRRGRKRRGQALQRDGDGSGKLLDKARRRGDKRTTRGKKTEALERADDMPKRWSPRALVHTVAHGRPNNVWGLVLPGEVATAVVDWLKVTWLNGS